MAGRLPAGASGAPRLLAAGAACALALALAARPARGGFVLATNLTPGAGPSIYNIGIGFAGGRFANEAAAQRFTPQAGGTITTIDANVDQVAPAGVPMTVSVYTAAGAVPGSLLGAMTFRPGQVSANAYKQLSSFDLSAADIHLTAGTSYFVAFSAAAPVNGDDRYRVILLENTPASVQPLFSTDGGASWQTEGVAYEIGLTVHGVPAPPAASLAAAGALTLAAWAALGQVTARSRQRRREPLPPRSGPSSVCTGRPDVPVGAGKAGRRRPRRRGRRGGRGRRSGG